MAGVVTALLMLVAGVAAQQKTYVDPNVNMVKGTVFPTGDPYLQRQNEPSIAISTRNPCHLVAGANDYRSVDIPFDDTIPPNTENSLSLAGDAWLGLFKSFDCGAKWVSTLLPGYPQDASNLAPELKGHAAGADPTVRAGTNGLFYYSGMVFNRGSQGTSKIFVARLIDNNNKERGDPIEFDGVSIVDTGTKGQFLDKPWMVVDVPRSGYGPGSTFGGAATCTVKGQTLPAGNVYMAWAKFTGNSSEHSKLMFAKSSDCAKTWKQHPISNNQQLSQGANLAVAPHDGTLYLTWREFAGNGSNRTVNFWIVTSSDGGDSWTAPKKIGSNVTTFDQLRSTSTFRSNALPAITADHENRVYVAWSARGYAMAPGANGVLQPNDDARIMMVVSSNRGQTWSAPFPIDPIPARGHQLMPSLTFAAGRLQAIWYDAREDVAGVWGKYIDDKDATSLLHTIDVRGAQATPAALPVFVAASELSHEISKYRKWNLEIKGPDGTVTGYESKEIGSNPPNLPMYANGTTPFIGDYIDVSGLPSFPVQTTSGQVWQPNIGPLNLVGAAAANLSTSGFPTLASFHATWTDNRDVSVAQCVTTPAGQMVGQRNANIYTARLTPGLYVGSPGNTKPFGYRLNPKTKLPELIQRGFVVFAQNTTDALKFYRFRIETQPQGGRASFKQFDQNGPLTEVIVSVPAASTVARTVYATSTDVNAQLLINIEQMDHDGGTIVDENGASKKVFAWFPVVGGLRGSVLLNPDRTNPVILDPDVLGDVPEIATDEVHNPSMFDAQFFTRRSRSNQLDVLNAKTPDPENPDPENPDPENPDPENPDPENPDPENPDPENPDPENPDPENPDPENPDPENSLLINSTISDADLQNATITDIQWKVHNSGNTTSAYRFRPSLPRTFTDQRYQLIVTRRSMALALGADCTPSWKSTNQVLSNIVNFQPKTPDPENPDPENPDPENPDPENPDPENPDPENPDPENANFFLAPEETATVTLRVFDLDKNNNEEPPKKREDVAAKTAAQAANTGQTTVSTAVAGPDLTLFDTPAVVSPAIVRPGKQATVTFTLSNRGTGSAIAVPPAEIRTRVYFSTDQILDEDDNLLATVVEPSPFVHCGDPDDAANVLACSTPSSVNVIVPAVAGTSYVIVITDEDGVVFEADELNNRVVVPIVVANYQLSFAQQPTSTTQDFTITPAVVVAVTHPDGGAVTAADVAGVTLALASNPAAGTLAGTLFQPNSGVVNANTVFGDLAINNAGNGYTLSATAPFSNPATSVAFNIEADLPPVVANDSYITTEEQALIIAAPGVLTNDSDPPTKGTKPAAYVFNAASASEASGGNANLNADGSFTYTPNANFAGPDTFTYRARDGRPGNQTLGTVTITVTSVNDVPSFTAGANQSVTEDAGAQSVPNWATNISKGPANEAGQVVDFIVTNNNAALFSAQPAVSANGTLTYTGATDANGVATVTVRIHDNGGTANGGVDTSAPQTFTITITGDNDPPVSAPDSYTLNEDAPLTIDAGGGNGLLANDTDPDGAAPTVAEYLTTTSNGTLLPHANGSFTYTPNPNFFGTDSFTYRAFDGTTTGNTVTVTFTVNAVNDAPAFTKGVNVIAPMGTGANSIPNWATAISAGPANEAAQALTFMVANDNGAIFATDPAIAANGTLTFTPRQNRTGVANVTVQLRDNGGTANGGIDASAVQTFTITITNAASTYVVTNTADSGAGSLRQALISANANSSLDTVVFNIPGGGVHTITPLTALPAIVFAATIDATTQPGFAGTPLIQLNGASAGAGVAGLSAAAAGVTIKGLAITQFQGAGVEVAGATANARITQNAIAGNGGLGIDLLPAGVDTNDALDADLGPNGAQNYPIVTGAYVNGASSLITGTIASAANTAYSIELFTNAAADPSGYGEGQVYRHTVAVTTDGSGNGTFSVTLPMALTPGSFVTATATDPAGNTSEFSAARVVAVNNPPTATNDTVLTVTDFGMTTTPASNDVDPDVAAPEVRTTYQPVAGAFGPLPGPGQVAIVTSTGLGYFTGGNQAQGTTGKIGILNLATNTVVGTIPLPGNFASAFTEVDQAAQIVFLRGGINLLAVDGRPLSPTFNQLLLNINLGTINSWALDSTRHRLYVTTQTTGVGLIANGRITVFDTDPGSPTFLQVINEASVPSLNGTATAIAVNTVTNKLYVSATGGTPGLYVADPATLAMTQVFSSSSTGNITSIAINETDNLIYAGGQTALHAVDGTNDTKFGQVALGGNMSAGAIDSRLLIHRTTGRVYARLGGFPNASNLVVVDGKRGSATINTIVATINLGRENGSAFMAIDESVNRLLATSATDLRSHVIDTTTNAVVGTFMATQSLGRVALNPATHRAYLTGGSGYIKIVDVAAAAAVTDVHVGTQIWGIAVDPLTHSAYVSETGLTTAIKRLNETGISGAIALPHGDGREVYMARNSVTNKIYALNGGATVAGGSDALPGFVHVIDGNTNTVTANLAVGPMPFGVAIDEANNKIYVGNQSHGTAFPGGISIIDGATNAVTAADVSAIPATGTPATISIGRDMVVTSSGRLYFRVIGGAATQMLGVLTGTVASPVNLGNVNINIIRYNPVTNRLYVGATPVGGSANQIFVIDAATNAVVTTLNLGSPTNFVTTQSYIAVNTATNRLFISDFDEMQLIVVDGATHAVVATIPMPFGPSTVAVDAVRNRVYVGNAIARSLTIVDGAALRVARTLALPIAPAQLFVDSSLSPARIFAHSTENEGAISVIDDPGTAAPAITSVTQGAHGTVTLNADGSVTYTSNTGYVGNDSYTYTTSDGQGGTTTSTANVTVYAELSILPAALPNGMVGQNYSQQLTKTGGSGAAVVWTVSGFLPGGLHLSSSGVLSGKLLQSGTFTFTVTARDLGQDLLSETRTYTITVGPPVITPTGVTSGTINVPYNQQLFAGGATGAVTWSLNTNGHPALSWLTVSNQGVLGGTPTSYGTTPPFTVTATDSSTPAPQVASRTFTIFVGGPLTMADLREGIVLETEPSVSFQGGNGTRGLTMTGGALPPGIVLGTGGVFTGTPTRHGTYNFTLELKDCLNNSCGSGVAQQTVNRNIAWRVSAKDQQGNSFSGGPSLIIGGSPNRKIAQVFTVGAQGSLTAIGFSSMTCAVTQTTVTVDVQRLTADGRPDGTTIATGSAQTNFAAIAISPPVGVAIGERLAFVAGVGGPLTCSVPSAAPFDNYNAGDAYISTGGGWSPLAEADADNNGTIDGVYDVPSFRTLIQPAMDVSYMTTSHGGNFAVVLADGRVLIGGQSNAQSAQIYDPATGLTTPTASMSMVRMNATATLLGNGTVLVAGGRDQNGNKNAQAEIFDPAGNDGAGTFTPIAGHMLWNARDNHRAVRFVHNGVEKVLITGGVNSAGTTLAAVEIYDPVTQSFAMSNNNLLARQSHVAVLLNNGKILLAGGYTSGSGPSAELFDPATNLFTATGAMVVTNRGNVAGALLNDGRVLITGGQSGDIRHEAEIYNPATNTFAATGNMTSRRYGHTATLLMDGTVLIAGGSDAQQISSFTPPLATLERFDPATGTFAPAGGMETRRASFAAAPLSNGKVLLVGGFSQGWMTGNTGELYDPAAMPTLSPNTLAAGSPGVAYGDVVFSGNGGSGGPYVITHIGGALPPGMTYNAASRTLGGTPAASGVYRFTMQVTDSASHAAVQTVSLQIGSINTITSPYRLPDAPQNYLYSYQLNATGAGNTWSLLPSTSTSPTNPLPQGITLSSSGLLEGTPTTTNYYNFGVRAIDALGVEAIKILSINVVAPLTINTTTLSNPELFSSLNCINTSNGIGTKTYSIVSGTLPAGVTFNGTTTSSCVSFAGQTRQTGTFNFRVRISDSGTIQQTAERDYTITVYAADQQTFNGGGAGFNFGAGTGTRLAERAITGITGTLRGIRMSGLSCIANGTTVGVEIQGLDAAGKPNGTVLATGTGVSPLGTIYLNSGTFFTADEPFAIVFDASASCNLRPSTFDAYPGDGFISNGGGAWQRINDVDNTRHDVPFVSLVEPVAGLLAMNAWRGNATETLLGNGKVLIAGGDCCGATAAAELFDPATSATAATGNMTTPRQSHTATLLPNGKVLLTGGNNNAGTRLSSAELYDPNTNTFTATGAMNFARSQHRATLLLNGTVLITGGFSGTGTTLNNAEIYDPNSGAFTNVPVNMTWARQNHTATLLDDGRVLIAAGYGGGSTAETYDPITQVFASTTSNLTTSRGRHTATLLDDGKVLITGGTGGVGGEALSSAELFDPASGPNGSFSAAPGMQTPRLDHTAVKLANGSVLIVGGYMDSTCCYPHPPTATVERYVPGTGFVNAGTTIAARFAHTATPLANDKVLLAGTYGWSSAAGRTAELFDAASPYLQADRVSGASGSPLNVTLQPAGGSGSGYTMTVMSGALPGGTQLNPANGQLTGTPNQSGTFRVTIKIVDSLGHTSYQLFTLNIDPITITTTSLPAAYQGVNYNGALSATGVGAITWSLVGSNVLPAGLSLNANTGAITGAPTGNCCYFSFTVRATDGQGQTAQKTLAIQLQTPLSVGTLSLGDGIGGSNYYGSLYTNGSGTMPFTWSISGQPIGLDVDPATGGFLANYPLNVLRQGGTFTIAAQVTDSSVPAQTATRNIPLNVYGQDQATGGLMGMPDITIGATQKIAQVYRSGTPYGISAVQVFSLYCSPGVVLTGKVYPVTLTNEPDDAGLPLATGTLTSNNAGFFNSQNLVFSPPVSMPMGTKFAVVYTATGNCVQKDWPNTNYYAFGKAWIDSGSGWTDSFTAIGREDLPHVTLVTPESSLRFLAGWRGGHVSATLNDGRVFLAGSDQYTEIYDPATNNLSLTASMNHGRQDATATVLANGKVLVAGGHYWGGSETVVAATTQLFNPATGSFEASQNMSTGRARATATRLANGNVLIAGGQNLTNGVWSSIPTADLFDGNGNLIATINMTLGRAEHTATLLNDGRVLIVAGWVNYPGSVAEIYDPASGPNGSFSASAASMSGWPTQHTGTLLTTGPRAGQVLIAGGWGSPLLGDSYFYNPADDSFSNAPPLLTRRLDHVATRLPNGKIVFSGGVYDTSTWASTATVETYDPATGDQEYLATMIAERNTHTADLVMTPNGLRLAIAAGYGHSAMTGITLEQFDIAPELGAFEAAGAPMTEARRGHVAVQLNDGTVLLAGNDNNSGTAELYNPSTDSTTAIDPMIANRCYGCAVAKLADGKVLIAGGWTTSGPVLDTAEIFNPANGMFTATTGNMVSNRLGANAVLLDNGKVLILGGHSGFSGYQTAELFDPVTQTFAATGSMSAVRIGPVTVKLADGRVLVAGGFSTGNVYLNSAEIYDPVAGTFSATGNMITGRQAEQAVLLDDGRVLVAGGWNGAVLNNPEVYDPAGGTFSAVGTMTTERSGHFVVKLANGAVVVGAGVNSASQSLNTAEMFDPYTNTFTRIANLPSARVDAKGIRLADGRIMITGGTSSGNNRVATVEYYVP